jgi:hypothetical protein
MTAEILLGRGYPKLSRLPDPLDAIAVPHSSR